MSEENKKEKRSLGHKEWCPVCQHAEIKTIKEMFERWISPNRIGRLFNMRASYIRYHADIFGWTKRRAESLKTRLERILEDEYTAPLSAAHVIQAAQLYAQLNEQGKMSPQQVHLTNMNELFERMTKEELLAYAEQGTLPAWFKVEEPK